MSGSRWRLVRLVLIAPLIAVAITALGMTGCQSRYIYYPHRYAQEDLQTLPKGGVYLRYRTDAGDQVAFYLPPADGRPPDRLWLACGGNGNTALQLPSILPIEDDPRSGWLLADYPGYGLCEGAPSPAAIRASLASALAATVVHLRWKPEDLPARLGVFGYSLGAATALQAGVDAHASRAVLVAPFTSMADMVDRVAFWPLHLLLVHRFDNRATIDLAVAQGMRVTLIHGRDDEYIPAAMSVELSARHPGKVTLLLTNGDHGSVVNEAVQEIDRAMRPDQP